METVIVNGRHIRFSQIETSDLNNLLLYLDNLSFDSKKRFGPHPFTRESLVQLKNDSKNYRLFIAKNLENNFITAYTIIKIGWLDFEIPRLSSYGLSQQPDDCTIAPSVADYWQGKGLGSSFLKFLLHYLKLEYNISRIFLWGGVQCDNFKAVNLYKKFGFRILGEFNYNGMNYDMLLEIDS